MKRPSIALGVALALFATTAAGFAIDGPQVDRELAAAMAATFLLFVPFFVFGVAPEAPRLGKLGCVVATTALLVPYVVYGSGTQTFGFDALGRLVVFVSLPTLFVLVAGEHEAPTSWDLAAILALWLPFDLGLLEGIWTWPEGKSADGLQAILAVDLALCLFLLYRRVPGLGYRFRLGRRDVEAALAAFLLVSLTAIPLGLSIHFIEIGSRGLLPLSFATSLVAILLFIGIPEELLFRGLIQNFFELKWGRNWVSLAAATLVFGAAHLNNGQTPNWAYALMATVAGFFYGLTYRWTGNVVAAALVHALADAVWQAWFR